MVKCYLIRIFIKSMYLKVNTATSRSGLVAHSRDIRGDLDMMVALVCMMGLNDHT